MAEKKKTIKSESVEVPPFYLSNAELKKKAKEIEEQKKKEKSSS